MKKILCFIFPLLLLTAAAFAGPGEGGRPDGQGRPGGHGGGGQKGGGESARPAGGRISQAIQTYRLARPATLERNNVVTDDRHVAAPQRYNTGEAVHGKAASAPPARHWEIAGNKDMLSGIMREQHGERKAGQYYWHNAGGRRYAHYYDDHGIDWYGFYFDSSFYWTRYYADRWWWYDDSFARWVFWWNNNWWWQVIDICP